MRLQCNLLLLETQPWSEAETYFFPSQNALNQSIQMSQGLGLHNSHFYSLATEPCFYNDVVECLPVDPVTWVRFLAETG